MRFLILHPHRNQNLRLVMSQSRVRRRSTVAAGGTAFALSHKTGGQWDILWPSSPSWAIGCTALVLSQRTGRKQRRGRGGEVEEEKRKDGGGRAEEAGQRKIKQPPH